MPALSSLFWTLAILIVFAFPFYSHLLTAIPRKPVATPWPRHLSVVFADARTNVLHLVLTLTFLAYSAYLMVDAVARTLWRMLVTHRHLLEWMTASEAQRTLGSALPDYLKRMWHAPAFSMIIALAVAIWRPEATLIAAPLLLAWALSPAIAYWVSKPTVPEVYTATEGDRLYLRRVARKSWRYFEEFVGQKDRWLAPDNFQEDPKGVLAHRTSPTNLSLLLLSTLSAHDMGYITLSEVAARIDRTLLSMEGLERYNGHFYNWYDTLSGNPLPPRYISTVDSGNLAGHLVALKNGCAELLDVPFLSPALVQGLRDLTELVRAELEALIAERRGPLQASQRALLDALAEQLDAIAALVDATAPRTMPGWLSFVVALVPLTADLATEVRRLPAVGGWWSTSGYGLRATSTIAPISRPQPVARTHYSVEDLAYWTDSLARAAQALDVEMGSLVPWVGMLESPPSLFMGEEQPEISSHWARLRKLPDPVPSVSDTLAWCASCIPDIRRLRARIRDTSLGEEGAAGAAAIRWLEELSRRVSASWAANQALVSKLGKLVARAEGIVREMEFDFLYDDERKLFSIGYNVAELTARPLLLRPAGLGSAAGELCSYRAR